jgi:hypothetical protein
VDPGGGQPERAPEGAEGTTCDTGPRHRQRADGRILERTPAAAPVGSQPPRLVARAPAGVEHEEAVATGLDLGRELRTASRASAHAHEDSGAPAGASASLPGDLESFDGSLATRRKNA